MQKHLDNYLEAADGASKVMAHARLLIKLARHYQSIAPAHLGQASSVANFKSGIVVLHACNGAVAAKLRQMAPSLAVEFSKRGVECNGVHVKVQAIETHGESREAHAKPLSAQTGKTLETLGNSLPASPLRSAIESLLAHALIQEKSPGAQ